MTMPETETERVDVERLRLLLDAATPGPWETVQSSYAVGDFDIINSAGVEVAVGLAPADAERIVTMHNAEHPAAPAEVEPCEHDGLGCRDRTPHDEHTKVGDGRPCCGWPPRCADPDPRDVDVPATGTIRVTVNVDTDDLREWAGWHADRDHHGVAHVLYKAAAEGESLGEQAIREAEQRGAEKALRDAADEVGKRYTTADWLRFRADAIGSR